MSALNFLSMDALIAPKLNLSMQKSQQKYMARTLKE